MSSFTNRFARGGVLYLALGCLVSTAFASISIDFQIANAAATTNTSYRSAPSAVARDAGLTGPAVGSTITVNSNLDVADGNDGLCTLREAITAANTNAVSGGPAGECAAGSSTDPDTISLTGVAGTIVLGSALPNLSSDMTIVGPGLSQLTISGNNAFRVFNVTISTTVIALSGLTISNGRANMDVGGAIYNGSFGTVSVTDCTLSNNSAVLGGAIANDGTFTLTNSTLSNNSAGTAGGVYNGFGTFNLINSTLNNNVASGGSGNGGGINTGSATLNIINSTISNNSGLAGAGIFSNSTDGPINITNSTLAFNSTFGGSGGGINSNNGASVQIRNSIIALNSAPVGPDLFGSFTSQGHNLVGRNDGSSGFTAGTNPNGDQVGTTGATLNPVLGSLQNNGGLTQTRALLPASPAIDAGDNCVVLPSGGGGCLATPLTTDQRGGARQVSTAVDIGAFESRGFTFSATSGTPQSVPVFTAFAPLVVTVSSASGDPVAGGLVTFTAPASGPSATFQGGVTILNAQINAGGQANPTPVANGIVGGPYTVTATVSGIASSASFTLTNTQAATSTAISSSANPSDLTQSVTFTATVTSTGTPTGTVQFKIDGSNAGAPVSLSGGVGTISTAALSVGTHTVTADYSGDANFLASTGTLSGGQVVRPQPSLSINDVSVTEGDSGSKFMSFTVTLSAASNLTVNVNFATADGTAIAPSDYVSANGSLNFNPGQTTQLIVVTINGDPSFEPNENFAVNLTNAVNASIAKPQGTGTIQNDDAQGGFIRFSQSTYTVSESSFQLTITVNRSNDISRAATVDYTTNDAGAPASCGTANGRASARCDFTAARGTLRFAAGDTQKTFTVLVNRDSYLEGTETVTLNLSNLTGGAVFVMPSVATLNITDGPVGPPPNLIDDSAIFVRQHYHDFLNREPDAAGLQFWINEIESCGSDAACRQVRRINVSAAFFLSIEFQETGYLVYRMYNAGYGETTSPNVAGTVPIVRLQEFLPDTQQIGLGVQVGIGNWQQQLEDNKTAYAVDFVQRQRFITAFPLTMTADEFVAKLDQNTNGVLSVDEKAQLVAMLGSTPAVAQKRGAVVRKVAEDSDLRQRELNRAFVLMEYYGYLRRNPDDPQDIDFRGWKFWLDKLNQFHGNFVEAEMVNSFLVSAEYRQRFGAQ